MSKLDRFLITDGILTIFHSITAICLDRHLSDHRPILLHEVKVDFGPTPFRFYHSWFKLDGFDELVEQSWYALNYSDNNKRIHFRKKLQDLKKVIRKWVNEKKVQNTRYKKEIISELRDIDKQLDLNGSNESLIIRRLDLMNNLNDQKRLSKDQADDLECGVSHDEDKLACWKSGAKNPRGLTIHFEYLKKYKAVKKAFLKASSYRDLGLYLISFTRMNMNIHKSPVLVMGIPRSCVESRLISVVQLYEENFSLPRKLRLTLLKSVLGASPLYNMSIFKVPKGVLKSMESIRSKFFKGASPTENKISWIAWDKVLASKKKGGLGISSFFALNRALLLKWVWRFVSQDGSLWYQVIQAVHGDKIGSHSVRKGSIWSSILKEVQILKSSGFDFMSYCSKRIGDGQSTSFWNEKWIGDIPLRELFPRMFMLESVPNICVADKLAGSLDASFRRPVRGGQRHEQINLSGAFNVKDTRLAIDDLILPSYFEPTRWVNLIPIKINVFMWRARRDGLPTRHNLVRKGVNLESTDCPVCQLEEEDVCHLLFRCSLAQEVLQRVCRWWEIDFQNWLSFSDWDVWFFSIRLPGKVKSL
ncbi:RNA-directed DNA polymerase, eukaryota [Tanacetum coccineum]